jgi:hypothetical protein
MRFVRIGSRFINLDQVTSAMLDDGGDLRVWIVGDDRFEPSLVFAGQQAKQLRCFLEMVRPDAHVSR